MYFIKRLIYSNFGKRPMYVNIHPAEDLKDLFIKIIDKMLLSKTLNCLGIITDNAYLNVFQEKVFQKIENIPYVMVRLFKYFHYIKINTYFHLVKFSGNC